MALLVIAAVGGIGVYSFTNARSPWGTTPQAMSSDIFTATADPSDLAISGADARAGTYQAVRATLFDPARIEGETASRPGAAIDGDISTQWVTGRYATADLDGSRGVGIVLDLGSSRSISAVQLLLLGSGSNVQVRVSATLIKDPAKWIELARADGAPGEIALRAPRPVVGQYVLLWFTDLALSPDGTYQGGVREVAVYG